MPVFSEMQIQKDAGSGHDGDMTTAWMMAAFYLCTSYLKASFSAFDDSDGCMYVYLLIQLNLERTCMFLTHIKVLSAGLC